MSADFSSLGINQKLTDMLRQNGITEPTPIQEQAIPELLAGRDMIAQAQTGTGKTLAFILPIIERIKKEQSFVQALVITPTRELALQITNEVEKLASPQGINVLAAYGGQDVERQVKKLKGAVHIVIGTPGRLLDHLRRLTIDFRQLMFLVLDEADQMLDMGFLGEVEQIIRQTSGERQTMLFSATMPREIRSLAKRYMKDPAMISVKGKGITLDEVNQLVVETTDRYKQEALCKMIEECRPFMAIVFCRTKRRTSALNTALAEMGYSTDELHGDISQGKREKVLARFREAELQLLIATDVAARGLDVEGVTHIFNYDIPHDAESYIHRIGRTARAGQKGAAITFVTPKDREFLLLIEKGINKVLDKKVMKPHNDTQHDSEQKSDRGPRNERNRRPHVNKSSAPKARRSFGAPGGMQANNRSRRKKEAPKGKRTRFGGRP